MFRMFDKEILFFRVVEADVLRIECVLKVLMFIFVFFIIYLIYLVIVFVEILLKVLKEMRS